MKGAGAPFYVPQLDGLRFCAFFGVFVAHASYAGRTLPTSLHWYHVEWWGRNAMSAGAFGVDLFFVLSSYLITSLLVREADTCGRISVPAFWLRRVLRIWPLYFGFLFTYAAWADLSAQAVAAFSLFVGNWALALWHLDIGLGNILWSVSVEEQFYLAWPIVLATVPRRFLRPVCVGLIMTAVVTRYGLFMSGASLLPVVWFNTFAHLDAIGVGALVALGPRVQLPSVARGVLGTVSTLGLVAGVGTVRYALQSPIAGQFYLRAGYEAVTSLVFLGVALACGGLLLAALAGSAWLSRPVLLYLGRISYGLYVFHTAAIELVGGWSWPSRLPAAFTLTLVVAAISYRYFEHPFLRLKARFTYVRSGGQA